jgi:hypothetical protein
LPELSITSPAIWSALLMESGVNAPRSVTVSAARAVAASPRIATKISATSAPSRGRMLPQGVADVISAPLVLGASDRPSPCVRHHIASG